MRISQCSMVWPVLLLAVGFLGCGPEEEPVASPVATNEDMPPETEETPSPPTETEVIPMNNVETSSFGATADGQDVSLFTCTNDNGLVLKMIDYGATVISLETPDRDGHLANITLGFDSLEGYLERHPYFGSTVGRYCNRIAEGKFTIDEQDYQVTVNNGPNHLHGGEDGFDRVMWQAEAARTENGIGIRFTYTSADGEEGYPGEVTAEVTYILTNDDELKIDYSATTTKPCPVNLTNHTYWNLAGGGSGDILGHSLCVSADKYLPVSPAMIPTGELATVEGTPFDFRQPEAIGARIDQLSPDEEAENPGGYDHCFVLDSQDGSLTLAARVTDPKSGRVMEIYTTKPGLQLYTGNFLDGTDGGGGYEQHGAFCLETQYYPDSPNQEGFFPAVLRPGEIYQHTTVHRFLVE